MGSSLLLLLLCSESAAAGQQGWRCSPALASFAAGMPDNVVLRSLAAGGPQIRLYCCQVRIQPGQLLDCYPRSQHSFFSRNIQAPLFDKTYVRNPGLNIFCGVLCPAGVTSSFPAKPPVLQPTSSPPQHKQCLQAALTQQSQIFRHAGNCHSIRLHGRLLQPRTRSGDHI